MRGSRTESALSRASRTQILPQFFLKPAAVSVVGSTSSVVRAPMTTPSPQARAGPGPCVRAGAPSLPASFAPLRAREGYAPIHSLCCRSTALAAVRIPAAAQSPTSFPWCMKGARGGTSAISTAFRIAGPRCPVSAAGARATRTTAVRTANKPGVAVNHIYRHSLRRDRREPRSALGWCLSAFRRGMLHWR